ncbi:MAG: ABC transporter ATP-binding protein, partial [Candidatus Geothermarchaeales archaeon]
IEYFASMYGVKADADELIRLVKLEDKRNALYKHLSGGLQKRLGIAISLVNDPEVVFLDEPTTGLDPRARRDVWDIIEMLREEGKTVFLTTHYMEEAERLADEAAIINYGRIIAKASPDELIKQHGGSRTLVVRGGGQAVYNLLFPTLPEVAMGSNGDVLVTLESKRDLTDAALALSGEKTEFEELIIKRPTMEDVFLNLTGKKIVEGELL